MENEIKKREEIIKNKQTRQQTLKKNKSLNKIDNLDDEAF